MDEADLAQGDIEQGIAVALSNRRREGPVPRGECLWCGEPVAEGRRWCDVGCRDAWESWESNRSDDAEDGR